MLKVVKAGGLKEIGEDYKAIGRQVYNRPIRWMFRCAERLAKIGATICLQARQRLGSRQYQGSKIELSARAPG